MHNLKIFFLKIDSVKPVGSRCSTSVECIANSECVIPSSGSFYSCQCKAGFYSNQMNGTCSKLKIFFQKYH